MAFSFDDFRAMELYIGGFSQKDDTMKRVNKGFEGGTLVTQLEVNDMKEWCYDASPGVNSGGDKAEKFVDRLWAEVQDLRSKLTKQIY
jgi:hypothetical protein